MAAYKVVEKFVSINGEGVLAGQPAVFIRFQGCNLSCSYCDTAWANQEDTEFTWMTGQQIYDSVKETGIRNVTLTGGEPLLVPDIIQLMQLLTADENLQIEVETNGSLDLAPYAGLHNPPAFTMDYKLPGSQMEEKMLTSNFDLLTPMDTVKFVVSDKKDLNRAKDLIGNYALTAKCHVYISPVFGKINPEEIVNYLIQNRMNGVNLQLQLHKVIWDPDRRGV